jgi:hypothetical protein
MAQASARLSRLAGLLAALIIAVLVAGPGLDAALCAGDGLAPPANVAIVHHESGLVVRHLHKATHEETPSGCQHGHVQGANACAETDAGLRSAIRVAAALPHGLNSQSLPPSATLPSLERPPRD